MRRGSQVAVCSGEANGDYTHDWLLCAQSKGLEIGKDKAIRVDAIFWTCHGVRMSVLYHDNFHSRKAKRQIFQKVLPIFMYPSIRCCSSGHTLVEPLWDNSSLICLSPGLEFQRLHVSVICLESRAPKLHLSSVHISCLFITCWVHGVGCVWVAGWRNEGEDGWLTPRTVPASC